jgi:predicted LPLAT superfamily acyltransferase
MQADPHTRARAEPRWLRAQERGTALGLRFLIFISTLGGRWPVRLLMWPVALYYVLVSGSLRSALRGYYRRLDGRRASWSQLIGHVRRFANIAVDRFFLVKGRFDLFDFTEDGKRHLEALTESKTGAILIGGHIGSFEAMRALSRDRTLPLNVVGYFRNARIFNEALERHDPGCNVKLIEIDPSGVSFIFTIKKCIERGELVAILGDRVGLGGQTASVSFLGEPATVPVGIYAMAAILRCPVYFTTSLYTEPNRYALYCEPFAERIELPRGDRQAALARYAQRYADRLEHYCRLAPDNWFNFHEFWDQAKPTEAQHQEAA